MILTGRLRRTDCELSGTIADLRDSEIVRIKKSKFTEEQIALALRQAELGTAVDEVCRKMGISRAAHLRWKQRYGGLGPSELRRLRQLEEESRKLKRLVADLGLDKVMLQEVLARKV